MSSNYGETGSGAQPAAGWYNDPQGTAGERYWDGSTWTDQTRAAGAASDPYAGGVGAPAHAGQQPAYATQPYGQGGAQFDATGKQVTTADGVPLASWWHRFAGWLIDAVITSILWLVVIMVLVGGPIMAAYERFVASGAQGPEATEAFQKAIEGPATVGGAVVAVLSFLYLLLMWRFVGARLGDLIVGLRAVPVDQGQVRGLPWRAALIRAAWFGLIGTVLGLIPVAGDLLSFAFGLAVIIGAIVAAADTKKQGWHDKLAQTQVVKTR